MGPHARHHPTRRASRAGRLRPSYSPDTYASSAVQQANKVEQGVVVGVRKVAVDASGATGAVTGAAAGGIAGSQAPGGTVSTALGALGGSLVGGLIGSGVERAAGDTFAYEYVVRKPNNELISVTQRDPAPSHSANTCWSSPAPRPASSLTIPSQPTHPRHQPKLRPPHRQGRPPLSPLHPRRRRREP